MTAPQNEVVVHCRETEGDVEAGLATARTLRRLRPQLSVRVIVNGPALSSLVGSEELVVPEKVEVQACEVGMQGRGIVAEDLRPDVATVDSAAAALADAQLAGAAYIRI